MEMLTVVTLSAIRAVSKGASPAGRGRGQSALHPEYRDREAVNEGEERLHNPVRCGSNSSLLFTVLGKKEEFDS